VHVLGTGITRENRVLQYTRAREIHHLILQIPLLSGNQRYFDCTSIGIGIETFPMSIRYRFQDNVFGSVGPVPRTGRLGTGPYTPNSFS